MPAIPPNCQRGARPAEVAIQAGTQPTPSTFGRHPAPDANTSPYAPQKPPRFTSVYDAWILTSLVENDPHEQRRTLRGGAVLHSPGAVATDVS